MSSSLLASSPSPYTVAAASSLVFLMTGVMELQAYMLADRLLSRLGYEVARWVAQAVFCWIVGWQLMNATIVGSVARAQTSIAADELSSLNQNSSHHRRPHAVASFSPTSIPATTAPRRRQRARSRPAGAAAVLLPLTPASTSASTSASASVAAAAFVSASVSSVSPSLDAFIRRERARVISSRLTDADVCTFATLSVTFNYTWEQVLEAQRQKLRPPHDPLNPSIMSVTILTDAADRVVEGGVTVKDRVRIIDSSIIEWVPQLLRGFLPAKAADGIRLQETLFSVPQARWAVTKLESKTCTEYLVLQVRLRLGPRQEAKRQDQGKKRRQRREAPRGAQRQALT